ncbi:MAG: hypothetical protein ACOC97_01485 [Myxococcota bacterium]
MHERLQRAWAERVHRASQWRRGEDPTPVLEALAQAVVLHLVQALELASERDRTVLEQAAGPALAAAREGALGDATERDGWLDAVALAELGRRLLRGEAPGALTGVPGDPRRPTPRRMASMLDGRLDGLSAAACAVWCLRHDTAEPRLLWRLGAEGDDEDRRQASEPPPVLVAAAGPDDMRDPAEGRVIAHHPEARAEAVWFAAERQLAVYAADDVHVRLSGAGLAMRDLRPGYWLGEVDPDAPSPLRIALQIGGRSFDWHLPLG